MLKAVIAALVSTYCKENSLSLLQIIFLVVFSLSLLVISFSAFYLHIKKDSVKDASQKEE